MDKYAKELIDTRNSLGYNLTDSILAALIKIAPTGKDQAALTDAHNDAKRDGGNEQALNVMLSIVWNGVNYGNWPWTK